MTDYSVNRLAARCSYSWMLMVVMLLSLALPAQSPEAAFTVEKPTVILRGLSFKLTITPALAFYLNADSAGTAYRVNDAAGNLLASGIHRLDAADPQALEVGDLILATSGNQPLSVSFGESQQQVEVRVIPAAQHPAAPGGDRAGADYPPGAGGAVLRDLAGGYLYFRL